MSVQHAVDIETASEAESVTVSPQVLKETFHALMLPMRRRQASSWFGIMFAQSEQSTPPVYDDNLEYAAVPQSETTVSYEEP